MTSHKYLTVSLVVRFCCLSLHFLKIKYVLIYFTVFKGNRWVSFDNQRSIAIKVNYAVKEKLAGVMIWAIVSSQL